MQIASTATVLQECHELLQEILRTIADNDTADAIDTQCQRIQASLRSQQEGSLGSSDDDMWVALVGNLSDGHEIYGPFESFDDADLYTRHVDIGASWIMKMMRPPKRD